MTGPTNELSKFHKDRFFTREFVDKRLSEIKGMTLGEIDCNGANYISMAMKVNPDKVQKGIAGDIIQMALGCGRDSMKMPDVVIDGTLTELKTTGVKKNKDNEYFPKEYVTVTDVSPASIVKETFEESAFYHKIEHILFVFYHYCIERAKNSLDYAQFPVLGHIFSHIESDSLEKLRNDWTIVRDFLLTHTFDDEDARHDMKQNLMVLDYSSPSQPRFRLKKPFMASLINECLNNKHLESLPVAFNKYSDFDNKCHQFTAQYKGKTVDELGEILDITFKNSKGLYDKDSIQRIIIKMFGSDAHSINSIKDFNEIGMTAKTIILTSEGKRTEDMKLFQLDFDELFNRETLFGDADEDYNSSEVFSYFADKTFVFTLFEEPYKPMPGKTVPLGECKFLGFKRYTFNEAFVNKEARNTWEITRQLVFDKTLKEEKSGSRGFAPNFPKSKDNIVFLRGSGSTSKDRKPRLERWGIEIKMYLQCLWVRGDYMVEELAKINYL